MQKLLILFVVTLFTTSTYGQNPYQPKPETIDAMKKVSFLTGNWKGSGWMLMGREKHNFTQTENITSKVNGTVIQIDGLGKDSINPNIVIHQAFAVISYDLTNSKYLMKAYRGDGAQIDADVKLLDEKTFQWGFSYNKQFIMRYTITVINNKWVEVGEMSQDEGKNWFKFFEMTLNKE